MPTITFGKALSLKNVAMLGLNCCHLHIYVNIYRQDYHFCGVAAAVMLCFQSVHPILVLLLLVHSLWGSICSAGSWMLSWSCLPVLPWALLSQLFVLLLTDAQNSFCSNSFCIQATVSPKSLASLILFNFSHLILFRARTACLVQHVHCCAAAHLFWRPLRSCHSDAAPVSTWFSWGT